MRIRNPWDGTSVDEFISGVAEQVRLVRPQLLRSSAPLLVQLTDFLPLTTAQLALQERSALARLALSPNSEARRLRHVLALWTLKEAYVKATGEGLHRDLRTIAFRIELDGGEGEGDEAQPVGEGALDGRRLDGWRFSLVEVDEGGAGGYEGQEQQMYWLAVAESAADGRGEVSLALRRPEWLREVALDEVEALARASLSETRRCT